MYIFAIYIIYNIYILYALNIYFINIHILYISSTYTHLKSKIWNQQPGTYLGSQPARTCSKKWIV